MITMIVYYGTVEVHSMIPMSSSLSLTSSNVISCLSPLSPVPVKHTVLGRRPIWVQRLIGRLVPSWICAVPLIRRLVNYCAVFFGLNGGRERKTSMSSRRITITRIRRRRRCFSDPLSDKDSYNKIWFVEDVIFFILIRIIILNLKFYNRIKCNENGIRIFFNSLIKCRFIAF